jgi:hypothetical protein
MRPASRRRIIRVVCAGGWTVARRDLIHWFRQPFGIIVRLLFPVMLVLMFGYLFGNPGWGGETWIAQNALLMAVLWPIVIFAVFFPLSVRRYRRLSR